MESKYMYRIGKKVRHRTKRMEGYITYSMFGVSVNGFYYEDGELRRFHTLSMTLDELKRDWKRIYKFKYVGDTGGNNDGEIWKISTNGVVG